MEATVDMSIFCAIAAVLTTLFLAFIQVTIIYRLWLHPLSKYPGPRFARISNLYSAYHAWNGDLHIDMLRCHEKYGDFVRYAPNRLLVNTNTGLKAIYGTNKYVQKSTTYDVMVHRAPSSLTMTDPQKSAQRRRIVSQGFSSKAVSQYESIIIEHVQKLAKELVRHESGESCDWSSPQNMSDWGNRFSFDVISDTVFGARHEMIEKTNNRYILECIDGANVRTSVLFQAKELTFSRIDHYLFPKSIESRNKFIPFISSLVRTRLQGHDTSRKDVFSLLASAKDPETGAGLSINAIGGECTTLVMAGSDTTSTVIASTLFYLLAYSDSYDRVKSELRQAFPTVNDIRLGHRLNSCKYLRACIDESLRLSPPVGGAPWRRVVSDGLLIDGQLIPKGCDVGTSIYALHHNSAYFIKPFVFWPSRWLTEGKAEDRGSSDIRLAQSAFAPFSIGPRSCLGKSMAYAELTLLLATLLSKYDIRAAEGPMRGIGGGRVGAPWGRHRENEFQLIDHITSTKSGPYVEFRKC